MVICVIGGGAAGFFAAINCAFRNPRYSVFIFEKSSKVLAKVRVSGGGRCNVTNGNFDENRLADYYPRGSKELRNAFARFNKNNTVEWFENRGVKLKTESDGRMFPVTDNSETIVQCLINEALDNKVRIELNRSVKRIIKKDDQFYELDFAEGGKFLANKVIITVGGSPNPASYHWIEQLGHTIVAPVPSLFTFNVPDSPLKGLEGISSQNAIVKLEGFKYESSGPLLITHWGISGPAVLKLSAFAARWLNENGYSSNCYINWLPGFSEERIRNDFTILKSDYGRKKIFSHPVYDLTNRLWQRLCKNSEIQEEENWADANKTRLNKLVENLIRMPLKIRGKTTFKEEFVTCGGINLKEVDMKSMESKVAPGIYFAGEVLDIDGVTGGFNFQSAWTTGYLAAMNV